MANDAHRNTLVVPRDLNEKIKEEAERNRRSKMAETIVLIEEALAARRDKVSHHEAA